jgi:hypothetical protein
MRIGKQALRHAHRQERRAGFFDKRADGVVGLRISRALAEDEERFLRRAEYFDRALHRARRRNLRGCGVDHLDERLRAGVRIHHLREKLRRQVEIDAARTPRNGRADRAGNADADVLCMQDAVGRLAHRLGDGELIHLLVVALLQVDDLPLRGARDQDHREAVRGGVRECGQAIEKAWRGDREADAGLFGEIARD